MKRTMPRIVLFLAFFIGISVMDLNASIRDDINFGTSQQKRSLLEILEEIGKKYDVLISYETDLVKDIQMHFEFVQDEDLESAFSRLLSDSDFSYELLQDKYVLVYKNDQYNRKTARKIRRKIKQLDRLQKQGSLSLSQRHSDKAGQLRDVAQFVQNKINVQEIEGEVVNTEGEPLIGVNIRVNGTNTGTTTDFDGKFTLSGVENGDILVISYIGYVTQEIEVEEGKMFDIVLEESAETLDEVVVVGFGTQESSKVASSVSQVSGEDLAVDKRPVTSIQSALIGSLPGLRGLNSNGRPGSAPGFSIRGPSTLNNSNILVIIDGFEGSLSDLDPQTIENVSILKDAAAVAIYGARGANGVMLVTTKSTDKKEGFEVSYTNNFSIQTPSELPGTLNSLELMEFENIAVTGSADGGGNSSAPYSEEDIERARQGFYPETVWPEELYDSKAGQQSHNLAIKGGTGKTGYLINTSFLNQKGLVIGADDFKRINLRLKIDSDITDWLSIGTNALISNRVTTSTPADGGNGILGSPFYPVKSEDGLWVDKGSPGNPNPVAQAASGSYNKVIRDVYNVQGFLKLNPIKGLEIEQKVSIIKTNQNRRDWNNIYDFVALDLSDPDSYTNPESPNRIYSFGSSDSRRVFQYSFNGYSLRSLSTLNYNNSFNSHTVGILLGFQSEQGENGTFETARTGYLLDNLIDLSLGQRIDDQLGGGIGNNSSRGGNATTLSFFGRLNYDYLGKYLAEISFRRDGSSNFLENNQWAFFPAVALGWNIAEESFLNSARFLDKLKLRVSYGRAGDDSGVGRRVTQLVNLDNTGYPLGGVIQPRLFLGAPASRDLKWETSTTFNIGTDISLWRGKLQIVPEYFITHREDILDEVITPVEFGFGNVPANLYAVKSWGWEIMLTHRNNIGDFNYRISTNLTSYDNEISDLAGRSSPNFDVGQSINDRFGFVTDGFFDSQEEIDNYIGSDGSTQIDQSDVGGAFVGGYKYVDQPTIDSDGDGKPDTGDGVINGDDRVILEQNSATNLNFGFSVGINYKGFSLLTRFYGAFDRNQWWSGADAHEPFLNGTNAFNYQRNYWRPDNQNAFFPVPKGNGIQGYSSNVSHLIFNNEFIKIQNITLSYDFSKSVIDRLRIIKGLGLLVSLENLGTVWTNSPAFEYGWDPELGVGAVDYPLPLTFSAGINVKF
ncbi:SusC/RagA family TonB-linked outer membrane protein [Membranihabitans maritimus]|uniref:SusC/RagA family TonB-linked outer membrane protein n=1 Tax=Membranihabitans maritimus TaxID=2904244 RepID=UPI001F003F4E|nr:SusC/RagA family TonB-linked outer membrane protein [Membranihabitans maritimus]